MLSAASTTCSDRARRGLGGRLRSGWFSDLRASLGGLRARAGAAHGIASDPAGNVYAADYTAGAFEGGNAGGGDGFVRSYDSAGTLRWTRQFGTSGDDLALGIATDASGDIYLTGSTFGYSGNPGLAAAFIRKYGP